NSKLSKYRIANSAHQLTKTLSCLIELGYGLSKHVSNLLLTRYLFNEVMSILHRARCNPNEIGQCRWMIRWSLTKEVSCFCCVGYLLPEMVWNSSKDGGNF